MRIFVDADAFPFLDITEDLAYRFDFECIFVCDTNHVINHPGAHVVTVAQGENSVDYAIANMISAGDLLLTNDIGLAAICDAKGASTFNFFAAPFHSDKFESMFTRKEMYKIGILYKKRSNKPKHRSVNFKQQRRSAFYKKFYQVLKIKYYEEKEKQKLQEERRRISEFEEKERQKIQEEIRVREEIKKRELLERQRIMEKLERRKARKKQEAEERAIAEAARENITDPLELLIRDFRRQRQGKSNKKKNRA